MHVGSAIALVRLVLTTTTETGYEKQQSEAPMYCDMLERVMFHDLLKKERSIFLNIFCLAAGVVDLMDGSSPEG